jgi:hypothetical protein
MRVVLRHTIILAYLLITGAAFIYTMTGIALPVPWHLLRWSYGMMAPYQGDTDWNADIRAEGKLPSGSWETIRLQPYYKPFGHGEEMSRKYLVQEAATNIAGKEQLYRKIAEQLLTHQKRAGKEYTTVRIWRDRWPRSPEGFEAQRLPAFTETVLLTEVP